MKLRKLPEALEAGWSGFRATLFAPPRTPKTYYYEKAPDDGKRGDIWIESGTMKLHVHYGRRGWRSLEQHIKSYRWKRYLTRWKK